MKIPYLICFQHPYHSCLNDEEKKLFTSIKEKYDKQISPYYAASRLWIDAIIDPKDTRKVISESISMANNAPIESPYKVGVIQT